MSVTISGNGDQADGQMQSFAHFLLFFFFFFSFSSTSLSELLLLSELSELSELELESLLESEMNMIK